jgi:hypothetical protein
MKLSLYCRGLILCMSLFAHASEAAKRQPMATLPGQVFIVTQGQQVIKLALVDVASIDEKSFAEAVSTSSDQANSLRLKLAPQIEDNYRRWRAEADKYNGAELVGLSSQIVAFTQNCGTPQRLDFVNCMHSTELADLQRRRDALHEEQQPTFERSQQYYEDYRSSIEQYMAAGDYQHVVDSVTPTLARNANLYKTDADGNFLIEHTGTKRFVVLAHAKRNVFGSVEEYRWLIWVDPKKEMKVHLSNENLIETRCEKCVNFRNGLKFDPDVAARIKVLYPSYRE